MQKKTYFMGCTEDKEVKWLRFFRLWIVFTSKVKQVPYLLKRKTICCENQMRQKQLTSEKSILYTSQYSRVYVLLLFVCPNM